MKKETNKRVAVQNKLAIEKTRQRNEANRKREIARRLELRARKNR